MYMCVSLSLSVHVLAHTHTYTHIHTSTRSQKHLPQERLLHIVIGHLNRQGCLPSLRLKLLPFPGIVGLALGIEDIHMQVDGALDIRDIPHIHAKGLAHGHGVRMAKDLCVYMYV